MDRSAAINTATRYGIPLNKQFHALPSAIVEKILAAAKECKYRQPRNANGSKARYFHAALVRAANVKTHYGEQTMQTINIGDVLTCAETGKAFIAARDGCTVNYARNDKGETFSDEGVDICEKRRLLNRSETFYCYVSSDGKTVGGWKGNPLGMINSYNESRSGWNGGTIARFRVIDVHGNYWSGRGAGRGMCCTLRPMKAPR